VTANKAVEVLSGIFQMTTALLDGKRVDGAIIDARIHHFDGLFRYPFKISGAGYIACSCGHMLQTIEQSREHWQSGHWDLPSYHTIDQKEPAA